MVKAFIKQWVFIFGLAVVSAFIIPPIFNGYWENTSIIIKLLVATFTVCIFNLLLERLPIELPLLKHFINMSVVLAVIFVYGWFWEWYTPSSIWIIPAMVVPVYVVVILLDIVKLKRDVELINKQIELRRRKRREEKQNDN